MAYELTERVLLDPSLPPGARLVLAVLASHANSKTKLCWPGIRRIMARTGMGERTVTRAVALLRAQGYIDTAKGRSKVRTTLYKLHPEKWPKPTTQTGQSEQVKPAKSDGSDPPTCKHNQEGNGEEESNKSKSKSKTCDKSQEKQVNNSSKPIGKSNKDNQVQEKKIEKIKTGIEKENINTSSKADIEKKKIDISSVAKLAPVPPPPIGTSKLAELWIEHASKQDVTACLTAKDGRMLRDAAKKIDYGNMVSIIPFVIADWKAFTEFCYYQGVGFTLPTTPQVAFFVKFVDKAFEFVKRRQRRVELEREHEDLTTQLLKLQVRRHEAVKAAFAIIDEPLPMTQKCEVLELTPQHVAQWEKAFGPVTVDYLQPECPLPGFLYYFHEDPTIAFPGPTHKEVIRFGERLSEIRSDRIWGELRVNRAYEKIARQIEDTEDRIKEVESSLKGL